MNNLEYKTDYRLKVNKSKQTNSDKYKLTKTNTTKLKPMEVIALVKSSIDIETVLDHYFGVNLSAVRGSKTKHINCLFHDERTPSMAVTSSLNSFNCFSCGRKGDILNLVGELKNISPTRAAFIIAEDFGLITDVNPVVQKKIKQQVIAKEQEQEFKLKEKQMFNLLLDFRDMLNISLKKIRTEQDLEKCGSLYHLRTHTDMLMDLMLGTRETDHGQRIDNFIYIGEWIGKMVLPILNKKCAQAKEMD